MDKERQLASRILSQLELYGEFYYKIEDWLTEFLKGNEKDLPKDIKGEYLRCALRIEIRDFFDNKEIENIESSDIEECVDRIMNHCHVNILNLNFISNIVDDYIQEKKKEYTVPNKILKKRKITKVSLINDITKLDNTYNRKALYRKTKDEIEKIYRKMLK